MIESLYHPILSEHDIEHIQQSQKEIREVYEKGVSHVLSTIGVLKIVPAYCDLMTLLEDNTTPEEIREAAEDIINEYLTPGDPIDSYVEVFQEYG